MATVELPAGYSISCDPARMQLDVIHGFLAQSYWAKSIPKALVERSMQNSLCWGVYHTDVQVGFARIVSDKATFAYLCDVFILPEHRGKNLSKLLMVAIQAHPELQGLRRWNLVTLDAHALYEQFGFRDVAHPERYMEIHRSGIYAAAEIATAVPGGGT